MQDHALQTGGQNGRRLVVCTKGRMTTQMILEEVQVFKPISYRTLLRRLEKLDIKPLGSRQNPQEYPADAGKRILADLGFTDSPAPSNGTAIVGPAAAAPGTVKLNGKVLQQTPKAKPTLKLGRVVSLKKLQSARSKSKAVGK